MQRRPALSIVIAVMASVAALAAVGVALWRGQAPEIAARPADPLAAAFERVVRRPVQVAPGVVVRGLAGWDAPEGEALKVALCDAIVAQVGRLPAVRVPPCAAGTAAVAVRLDDERLARLLGVSHVLSGHIEPREGRTARLQLSLREATGREVWQWGQDVTPAELQALPQQVARATAQALGQPQPAAPATLLPPEAYEAFVEASQLARRESIDGWRTAMSKVEQVLAAHPDHVPTLYLRQGLRQRLASNAEPGVRQTAAQMLEARRTVQAEGLALARRLAALDPEDLRAQSLLVSHDFFERRWQAAFDRLDAVLARSPRAPGLMRLSATLHLHAGYIETARQQAVLALQDNAFDRQAIELLVRTSGSAAGSDAALSEALALAQALGHPSLGYAVSMEAARRRDWPAVEVAHAGWIGLGGKWPADWVPAVVRGMADPQQREAAVALLDAHDPGTRQHFAHYMLEYAMLGAHDRALQSVRELAKLPPAAWLQQLWWSELSAVRRQPGFVDAMADQGLLDLWRTRGAPDLCQRDGGGAWHCR